MSTEPNPGQQQEGQSPDPNKVAEAEKLFDKLFGKTEPANIVNTPPSIPPAVVKQQEAGETFTRKVAEDTEGHTFQRVVKADDDHAVQIPDRVVPTAKELAVPPPRPKAVETSSPKSYPDTQDIPTAVDAVNSDKVKAELLARAKAAKYAAKPELDFPARVNNIKTQNDKLRARLESLERQE
jgi:hypothetical protein